MWVVYNGWTCCMLFDKSTRQWVYIRERDWYSMTSDERKRYALNRD